MDLLWGTGVGHLHDAAAQPGGLDEQAGHRPRLVLPQRLPRGACLLGFLLDVPAAVVGEAERAPAAGLLGLDQALVGELLQGRVDRAGAGPPGAAAALLDLGHDLVPVARAFAQQRQDRGAHVAAAGLRPACLAGRARPPAAPVPAEVTGSTRSAGAARSARAGWPLPGAFRASGAPLPRPAAPARAMPAAHPADGALDLAQHAGHRPEHLEEARIEVPGR